MDRISRSTNKNNIVIVCEGEDTEPSYLIDLQRYIADRFDHVRIVPFDTEAKDATKRDKDLKKNNGRKTRRTLTPIAEKSGKFYWVKEETDIDLYKKYCGQPTRYVREAQLFLEDGYVEAWAVYDHDKFPDHKGARELADSDERLNVAFSSVSFEEWLLLHFERNHKAFDRSCCKQDKKDLGCGCGIPGNEKDCHGNICVAGYLRQMGYIPNFTKSKPNLFSEYTRPRLNIALINAAWVRTLAPHAVIYERNPFTDFDILLQRLLGITDRFEWAGDTEKIKLSRTEIHISRDAMSSEITLTNIGSQAIIFQWTVLDELGLETRNPESLYMPPEDQLIILMNGHPYLQISLDNIKYIITI